MKVRLNAITSTPSHLVCGVQIHGPMDSWIRFGVLEIPWEQVPPSLLEPYYAWLDRDERNEDLDEPLALDWG